MSAVHLEAESVLYHVIESMLPRFSDAKLGLMFGVDMHLWDSGYEEDGNTRGRKEKNVRLNLFFLIVRSSNYTKVLFWEPKKDAKGLDGNPRWSRETVEWFLLSDHDSCWRDAIGSKLTDAYFESCKHFKNIKVSGKPLRPCDISRFITLTDNLQYVCLDTCEQTNKQAERFSSEARVWSVKQHPITLASLEMIESTDLVRMGNSGLLIKGSEDHQRYLNSLKRYQTA